MIEPKPYLMYNKIQNYAWGTKGSSAFIPSLLGFEPEKDTPYAELWLGAHSKASSEIVIDGNRVALNKLIEQFPEEILGKDYASEFGNALPYLFKVLSAGEPLSIQAHPSKDQAKVLHSADPVNYPDENHKPEIAIALDELSALVGFKEYDSIKEIVKHFSGFAEFIDANVYENFVNSEAVSESEKVEKLRTFYSSIITGSVSDAPIFKLLIDSIKTQIEDGKDKGLQEYESLFLEMYDKYGYDIGLMSILFFNLLKLQAGEAIYTPAGLPHAYVGGNIIECMANSDNVIRAGLTPKFKDIDNLLKLMDYTPATPALVDTIESGNSKVYKTPAKEFSVEYWDLKEGSETSLGNNQPSVLLLTEGSLKIVFDTGEIFVQKGNSILIPAILTEYEIKCQENCKIYKAGIN